MQIEILGTRGEIEPSAPYHSRRSGILIDDELLLDVGEEEFLKKKPRWIIITHLHPDHAYFVRNKQNFNPGVPVYAPQKSDLVDARILKSEKTIHLGKLRITPLPTHHSKTVKSFALIIERGKSIIIYTSDMIWINKEHHHHFENLDLAITEASFLRKGGMIRRDDATGRIYGHKGVPDFIDFFKPYTNKILLVHFGSWFYKMRARNARKKVKKIASQKDVEVTLGYDGMKITV